MNVLGVVLHLLGAAASIAAAFAINTQLRPVFDTQYEPREYAEATGTLSLSQSAGNLEIPLMTTHVVTREIPKLGRVYQVRELCLRAAADGGGQARLELFADVGRLGELSHDPSALLQAELPLLRAGRLGARRSYVMLDASHASGIATGNLLLTEIVQMESGERPVYRAEGRLEIQVETDHGIDLLTGRTSFVITWDATGA